MIATVPDHIQERDSESFEGPQLFHGPANLQNAFALRASQRCQSLAPMGHPAAFPDAASRRPRGTLSEMSVRGILPLLGVAVVSMAWALFVPFQFAPTEALALVHRMNDIDRGLLERPDDDALLRLKIDMFQQTGLLSHAFDLCRTPRPSGRPSVCEPALTVLLQTQTEAQRSRDQAARSESRLFAVIIGIANYQKGRMPRLPYADSDALEFAKYIQTARTGAALSENVFLLVNEAATAKRIREALETVLNRAGPRDTVSIFVSAHGLTESAGAQEGFLMAYDSDPQEMQVTAYRLSELNSLVRRRSPNIGKILLYADICRAGSFHNAPNLIQTALQQQLESPGARLAAVVAGSSSQPSQTTTVEGGHSIFSYYLVRGLNGEAGKDPDGHVTMDELFAYVRARVMDETRRKQQPKKFGELPPPARVASTRPWLYRNRWSVPAVLAFGFVQAPQDQAAGNQNQELFIEPGLPFDFASGPEDEGQQVILNYLQGSEIPQAKEDFDQGAAWFHLAAEHRSPRIV